MTSPPTALDNCTAPLAEAVSAGIENEAVRNDLDSNELMALQLFGESDEWTATQLVERLNLDPPSVSRLVARLADKRLLRRRRSRTDRRVVYLSLASKGEQILAEIMEKIHAHELMLLDGVTKTELDGFYSTAHKILDNYSNSQQ